MWTRQSLLAGVGDRVSFGSVVVRGFALGATAAPEVWTKLTAAQQTWVVNTLVKLNNLIVQKTGTTCPTWAPAIDRAAGCFQAWFNKDFNGKLTRPDGSPLVLRTDGVFDQDTLDALRTVAALHGPDFPAPFPGTEAPGYGKKLSTGAMVGIGVGVVTVGGIIYAATRGKARRRR